MVEKTIILLIIILSTSILFLDIGKYSKNYLFMFISIIILLSILLTVKVPEGLYISFIFIIVYVSALSIMFGFLIMLTPNIHNGRQDTTMGVNNLKIIAIICYLLFISTLYLKYSYILGDINNYSTANKEISGVSPMGLDWNSDYIENNIYVNQNTILNKLGIELYSIPNNLFKLFLSLIILLISLFSLFYIFQNPKVNL